MTHLSKPGVIHFEPDLNGFSGHSYSTVLTIKEIFLKNGHSYRIVTGDQAKLFNDEFLKFEFNFGKIPKYCTSVFGSSIINPIIYNYLTFRAILKTRINANELIYFNTCQHLHMFGVLIACVFKKPKWIVLTFRLDTYHSYKSIPRVVWYFVGIKLLQIFFGHKLIFVTDSVGLVDRFKKIYRINLIKLPIPHLPKFKEQSIVNEVITIGSLGPASRPKNILHTINALKSIDTNLKKKINYIVYIYGELSELIEEKLNILNFININIIKRDNPVSRLEYLMDLEKTNIVLVNYLKHNYKYNTSGVFSEAYSLNKMIITTAGTWMAENSNNCSGVILIEDPKETSAVLLNSIENYQEISSSIRRLHPTESFYKSFMSSLI